MSGVSFAAYLVGASIVVFVLACMWSECSDCEARGGVMVRGYGNAYVCVAAPPKAVK